MADTIMVSYHQKKPTYRLEELQQLIAAGSWDYGTDRCIDKVRSLGLARGDVARMLLALREGDFRKVYGTCTTRYGELTGDDYVLNYDEENQRRGNGVTYYIKLAVCSGADDACIVVSFHPSMYL